MTDQTGQAESLPSQGSTGVPFAEFLQTGHLAVFKDGAAVLESSEVWAGHGEGKNNPAMEDHRGLGPLPRGWYDMLPPEDHEHLGTYAIQLVPDPANEMFGRTGFWMHGGAKDPTRRGEESLGCVIAPHDVRVAVWESGARRLRVA